MSSQSMGGPLVTHVISIGETASDQDDRTMLSPVLAFGTTAQERLADELVKVLRSSLARYRGRRGTPRIS